MSKIINCLGSLFDILGLYFKNTNPEIIFYYPQHFNRSKLGDNDFLRPLIDSCGKNAIPYLIFEEPANTNFPRNHNAIKFDLIYFVTIVLRKLIGLKKYQNFEEREWKISSLIKSVFFRNFKPKVVITMSNSMLGFFRGWGKDIAIYDYQHGIIYATHPGYMVNLQPSAHIQCNNSKVLVYGNGFKNLLINQHSDYFVNHAKVIGADTNYQNIHQKFNGKILITLPIATFGEITAVQEVLLMQLNNIFKNNQDFYLTNNIQFYLKHHPRFDGSVDVDSILFYSFVHVIDKPLFNCFEECSLHLTYNSTTTFDAAIVGIPTLFLGNLETNLLFNKDFQYPDFELNLKIQESLERLLIEMQYYSVQATEAQNWVKSFYEPFNEGEFLKLIYEKD